LQSGSSGVYPVDSDQPGGSGGRARRLKTFRASQTIPKPKTCRMASRATRTLLWRDRAQRRNLVPHVPDRFFFLLQRVRGGAWPCRLALLPDPERFWFGRPQPDSCAPCAGADRSEVRFPARDLRAAWRSALVLVSGRDLLGLKERDLGYEISSLAGLDGASPGCNLGVVLLLSRTRDRFPPLEPVRAASRGMPPPGLRGDRRALPGRLLHRQLRGASRRSLSSSTRRPAPPQRSWKSLPGSQSGEIGSEQHGVAGKPGKPIDALSTRHRAGPDRKRQLL